MKNFIIIIALAFNTTASFAATNFTLFFTDNRGMEQARILANKLQLNESTFIKLKQLEDRKFKELDEALSQDNNMNSKEKIRLAIEIRYNLQIRNLLTPSQKEMFVTLTEYKVPAILAIEYAGN